MLTLRRKFGACRSLTVAAEGDGDSETHGTANLETSLGLILRVGFSQEVSPESPDVGKFVQFRILALESHQLVISNEAELFSAVQNLPGHAGFALVDIESGNLLASQNGNDRFAIGSVFKLYVLAAVQSAIRDGSLRWDDAISLHESLKSLPSGELQNLPAGTIRTVPNQLTIYVT